MNIGDYVIIKKPKYREGRMLSFKKEMDKFNGCYGIIKDIGNKGYIFGEEFDYPVYIVEVYEEKKERWNDSTYGYYEDWLRELTAEEKFMLISVVL
jgi:hypothetical protein